MTLSAEQQAVKKDAVKEIAGIFFDVREQLAKAKAVAAKAGVPLGVSLKEFGFFTPDEAEEVHHDDYGFDWNGSRC